MPTLYEITYTISNILGTYIIYKLMRIFFGSVRVSGIVEFTTYTGYYLINLCIFFLFGYLM